METNKNSKRYLAWALLAGASALLLATGLSLLLSRFQVLAQPAGEVTADLGVTKEVNQTLAAPGDTLVYTITIENYKTSSINAWMTDTLPAELTYVSGTLSAFLGNVGFENGIITWSHTLAALQWDQITFRTEISSEITYAEVVNTAQVTGSGELIEDAATTLVVVEVGNLDNAGTYKTVTSDEAEPGDVLTYTIRVTNNDTDPVPDAWFTDTLPAELIYIPGSLSALAGSIGFENGVITWSHTLAGLSYDEVSFSAQISPDLPYDGWITNTVEIVAPLQSFTREAGTWSQRRYPHLEASKSVSPDWARPGENLTYTVRITNTGDGLAETAWMTDVLPSEVNYVTGDATTGSLGEAGGVVTWTGSLAPAEAATIAFVTQIEPTLSENAHFTNTAEITGAGTLVQAAAPAMAMTHFIYHFPFMFHNYPPAPVLNPIPTSVNRSYTVSWWDIGVSIDHYVLQQARTSDFSSIEQSWETGQTSQLIEDAYCAYYYRVRADKASDWGEGPWSNVEQGEASPPDAPVLNDIPDPGANLAYDVSWSASPLPVDRYVLEEATDANFTTITRRWWPTSTSQQVQNCSSYGHTFYYRVRADDDDCWGQGPWSNVKSVAVSLPTLVLNSIPAPGANLAYEVTWSASPIPIDWYVLEESFYSNFSVITRRWWPTSNSQQIQNCSSFGHIFYYRVRTHDNDCWGQGPWSNVKSVAVFRPTPVLNDIPSPGGDGSYTVSWSPVSIPIDQYVLQESTDAGFTSVTQEWRTTETSQLVQPGTSYGILYYRVRADDDDCWGQGPWSELESVDVPYFDDFNDSGSGWPHDEGVIYTDSYGNKHYWRRGYSGGQYYIKIDQGGPLSWFYQPDSLAPYRPPGNKYCIETKAKFEEGNFWANMGLIFGANEENTDIYALCMGRDDTSGLGWFLMRSEDYHFPKGGCASPSYKIEGWDREGTSREGWNRLQIGVDGDKVTVYIGGHYKGQWTMSDLKNSTRVGVIGGPYELTPIDVRFAYFKVTPNASCTP